jgi:hypothetical protein
MAENVLGMAERHVLEGERRIAPLDLRSRGGVSRTNLPRSGQFWACGDGLRDAQRAKMFGARH